MAELHVYADTVPEGGYSTIQDAIDASAPGDTIIVHPGSYSENLVLKTTDVTLVSSDGPGVTTITPADPELDTIRISGADGTTVEGFAVVGGTNPQTNAIHVHGIDGGNDLASDVTITGNVITRGEGDGIKLSKVSDIVIDSNTISGGGDRESGIDLVGGERIIITNNTLLDMGYVGISPSRSRRPATATGPPWTCCACSTPMARPACWSSAWIASWSGSTMSRRGSICHASPACSM